MPRPRSTYTVPIRFQATSDGVTRVFGDKKSAQVFAAQGRRAGEVKAVYFVCRGWELRHDHVPRPGEPEDRPDDWTGAKLYEVPFALKGADEQDLLVRANARRRQSYRARQASLMDPMLLASLPPAAKRFAREVLAEYDGEVIHHHERYEERKRQREEEEARKVREAAIPTLRQLHERDLERRSSLGLKPNTVAIYRYEFSAFAKSVETRAGSMIPADTQVHRLPEGFLENWFDGFLEATTRHNKKPSKKTWINALSRVKAIRDLVRRDPELRSYASIMDTVDVLLEDVRSSPESGVSWRRRRRLTHEEVGKVIAAAEDDLDYCLLAVLLTGCRAPSEAAAAEWSHLHEDGEGNLWWQVQASVVEVPNDALLHQERTKTGAADYRQLSICRAHKKWLERRKGLSRYLLGDGDTPMTPYQLTQRVDAILSRSNIKLEKVSAYSFRHTIADEVEGLFGTEARDLILHGQAGRRTGDKHYSHATRQRRLAKLTFDGLPYSEHFSWAK